MVLEISKAVYPTIKAYLPKDYRHQLIIQIVETFLEEIKTNKALICSEKSINDFEYSQSKYTLKDLLKRLDDYFQDGYIINLICILLNFEKSIRSIKKISKELIKNTKMSKKLFPECSVGIQAVDEAFDVFKNLLEALQPSKSQSSLLEILDDCFQGYAIFPGSENRRDLFNWWLLDVVPAVWKLETPQMLYTIHGLQPYE